jgi:hypothetical protein
LNFAEQEVALAWGSLYIGMVVGALLVVGLMGCFFYRKGGGR